MHSDEKECLYLADRLDAADRAEENKDPRKQQTENKVPLDSVRVSIYAV